MQEARIQLSALLGLALAAVFVTGCGPRPSLLVLSGSENQALEPLLAEFSKASGVDVQMKYSGSVDIMLELQKGASGFDAVWPASDVWISLGDTGRKVKLTQSIMTSPVVFGIKKSVAEKLGFVGKEVRVRDILAAIESKKLSFAMTSASQSNSGASAYLGFLYALLGNPDVITAADLDKPALKDGIRTLLSGINRSSGSSAWLKDLFLASDYDAMVNYESLIIETNRELVKAGREPLYIVYPVDGIVMSDSPLGYVDNGDAKKQASFRKLQEFLLKGTTQAGIAALGRRTGLGGLASGYDKAVFKPEWGADPTRILSPIRLPAADVILRALTLYQTEFRKPSLTVYCLDFSGSMGSGGSDQVKEAMGLLLDPEKSRAFLLQPGSDDVSIVIPFNNDLIDTWKQSGNDPGQLADLLRKIVDSSPGGGTDIYSPVMKGLDTIATLPGLGGYVPAVILMTDGQSNTGKTFYDLKADYERIGKDIPIFCIAFGEASEKQLGDIAGLSRGRVFDGRKDLVTAFRGVKGYN
jgi:Ca-activated chloride channel family protein